MILPDRSPDAPLSTGPLPSDGAVVVTPHYLASQAGIGIIEQGGSAVDAAIAADAVLAVVAPDTCGPGGDLFAIIHRPGDEQPAVLNASGRAGSRVSAAELRERGLTRIPMRSRWSITVPGCVDGWEELVARYARLGLGTDLAPAIGLAREGFPASTELSASLGRLENLIASQGSAAPLYPNGRSPAPGDSMTRPDLAETLQSIADDGRDAFYLGAVGDGIIEATGALITRHDLERRQTEWVEPASIDVFGSTAWTVPPNSQGWLTLATLRIFEMLDPPADPDDPAFHHTLIEAYRAVAWERADTVCDPSTAPIPVAALLDEGRLAERAATIDPGRARRWPVQTSAPGGTAYLTVRDRDGMAVSFIQSNFWGIGSGRSAGATGVWLHNRGAGFELRPGHPNELVPGRRPLHTLSPTLWTRDGVARLILGTRGGDQQPQLLAQMAATMLYAGASPGTAQRQPRWFIDDFASDELPAIRYEPRFPPSTIEGLTGRGHDLHPADAWETGWGPVSTITIDGDTVVGDADPRVSTTAAVGAG